MSVPAWKQLSHILTRWEQEGTTEWSAAEVAAAAGISTAKAGRWIQAYLGKQRNDDPAKRPDLIIHRVEHLRTSKARYRTGNRVRDARSVAHSLSSDILCKYERATGRDITAILESNPNTRARFAAQNRALSLQVEAFVAAMESI